MLEVLEPLIQDSYDNEPSTWTYHWSLPTAGDRPNIIKGLEMYKPSYLVWAKLARFDDRDALENIHMKTPKFTEYIKTVEGEKLLGTGFHAVHVIPIAGFPARPNESSRNIPFVSITKLTFQPGKRGQMLRALKDYAGSQREVLSFLVLKAIDDDDILFIWERYSSERAVRRVHQKRVRFWSMLNPLIKEKTVSGYLEKCGFVVKPK